MKGKIKLFNFFSTLIIIIFTFIIIICLYKIGIWFYDNYKTKKIKNEYKEIQEEIDTTEINKIKSLEENIKDLKNTNPNTVGWIKVNNTNISYPVVKANDNEFYLERSFDRSYNSAGWIFMDYKNKLDGTDKNIVIYGHNRRDESMFGSLKWTLNEDWYNNNDNKIVLFITENEVEKYEIYSVYETLNEEYYINTDFTEESYKEYIEIMKERSIHNFNTVTDSSRPTLTLSTCSNNNKYRTVLHAIKVK